MLDVYSSINELLTKKESFCLATVLTKSGSAPREEGTKMIIKKDFSIIGTVGGGIMEALTIKLSKEVFEKKCSVQKYFNFSNKEASSLGMVCGGDQKVLEEYIGFENPDTLDIYSKAYQLKEKNINFVLITKIGQEEDIFKAQEKWICTETAFYGSENDEIQSIFKNIRENFKNIKTAVITAGENRYLIEPAGNDETVYIIGAGHVSQKLAAITKIIDFKTAVFDDRSEFANRDRFPTADIIKVIPTFKNIFSNININRQSYIIIVTRGHAFDKEVLKEALKTNAKYIGMIGSKTKRQFVYDKLLEEGFTEEDLKRVYSPIGISIKAQTPEEIAVSIAAELIKIRRG